jgi:hypothetical protein
MKPILTVEFTAKAGDYAFKEESVSLHRPEELFEFVSPGGGCEKIPDEVEEIRMVFLPPEHRNANNPIADAPAMLQLHMVLFTGPLSEISQIAEQVIDRAGRGELSDSFLKVIGLNPQ